MKGSVNVVLHDSKIRYEFCIRRNITVIRGKGGTGKTTLYDMVRLANMPGSGVKMTLSANAKLATLAADTWELVLAGLTDSNYIFVLDEFCQFMRTQEFARAAKLSGCYFILITRDNLAMLPCSIHEMYELYTVGRTVRFSPLYSKTKYGSLNFAAAIITEDSNSDNEIK